jgi:tripeptide aminopeptidase
METSFGIEERFLKYVRINTQSNPDSKTHPSSENQKVLGEILVKELSAMNIDAAMDDYGYVIATIPSNTGKDTPVLCFCAHLDTSPEHTAEQVNPVIHRNYDGNDIVLPKDARQIIKNDYFPELAKMAGKDIITGDGTTLLGADNKAGVAELMTVAYELTRQPEIKHGTIKLLFTPDEEIGKDVIHLDLKKLGADYAYSVDGHARASINDQTFFVGDARVEIYGSTIHTGKGDGVMESAIKIAATIIQQIPLKYSPEAAKGKEGFIHPARISGKTGSLVINFQLRAFEEKELLFLSKLLSDITRTVLDGFERSTFTYDFQVKDRNIKEVVDKYPFLINIAKEAIIKAGMKPKVKPLRGSTTGASLSFMGLPCPNIFTGQHGVHGKLEWVCIQDMEKAVETILNICQIWEEKSGTIPFNKL